ncbi:hypothetical protein F2Q70_00004975 [Brassica cretica]|uniref:Uncharacterized protein n=1 Tax=Brassica cretica TaxID=69181 RepID=A0A8S9J1T2_BRACR|nr:hypothetical protein F2Q70_00004975 [Brassica cretica]
MEELPSCGIGSSAAGGMKAAARISRAKIRVRTPFERLKTDLVKVYRKVNPLVKGFNYKQTSLTGQRVDSLSRLSRVAESPVTGRRRRLTGKSPAAAASRWRTDGGRARSLRRTVASCLHPRRLWRTAGAKAKSWEALAASSGVRLRRGR